MNFWGGGILYGKSLGISLGDISKDFSKDFWKKFKKQKNEIFSKKFFEKKLESILKIFTGFFKRFFENFQFFFQTFPNFFWKNFKTKHLNNFKILWMTWEILSVFFVRFIIVVVMLYCSLLFYSFAFFSRSKSCVDFSFLPSNI